MSTAVPLRVLAIDPIPKGAAFAVFEGEQSLLDWGFKTGGTGRPQDFSGRIQALITRYEPDVLVLEDVEGDGSHRRPPAERVIGLLHRIAGERGLHCVVLSRADIRAAFRPDRQTRRLIAEDIVLRFPELQETLPPARKWFESGEDERMSVFDAAAMALAFFSLEKG